MNYKKSDDKSTQSTLVIFVQLTLKTRGIDAFEFVFISEQNRIGRKAKAAIAN